MLLSLTFVETIDTALAATTCSINSTTTVTYSAYNVFSAADDNSTGGGTAIKCTASTTAHISLSKGGSGTYASRTMTGPGGVLLNYNLYTTAARTTVWGDATSGTAMVSGTVGTTPVSFTIYGLIPKNQYTAAAGAYTDSITVSVTP